MIEIKNITKGFEERTILKDISAVFETGKCNLIIGASGSGKSVLTKVMVGLFEPNTGDVLYDGVSMTALEQKERKGLRQQIGMLFQGSALFDSMTVLENILFPLDMFTKMPMSDKKDRVNEVLKRVNLVNANLKFPSQL